MPATRQEIYQRYLWATLTQNADAVAEMFAVDGVFQAPLVPADRAFPRHLKGREEIRAGLAEYYHRWADEQEQAGLRIVSPVKIFRIHDGQRSSHCATTSPGPRGLTVSLVAVSGSV